MDARRTDWRAINVDPISLDLMPAWYRNPKQEERFKRILIACIVLILLFLLVLTFSPLVEREKKQDDEIVFKTKVILKPVTIKEPEPEPEPPPKPKPKPKPVPTDNTQALARSSAPTKKPTSEPTSNGLAKVSNQLSALRNSFDLTRNRKKNLSTSKAGKVEKTSRNLLGKDSATKKSGGIKVDSEVMLDDRTTLAGHSAAAVEGVDHGGVAGGNPVSRYASHISGERTMESIRYTLERKKGRVFALYYQALNNTPSLSGKYTFEMRIEPSGEISSLRLISSELSDPSLDNAILDRIRDIQFKQEDVITALVTYTYVFIEN